MKYCPRCYLSQEDMEYVDDMEAVSTEFYCPKCKDYFDYSELEEI